MDEATNADANAKAPTWIEQALDRYERPLLAYARRLLGEVDAAHDVVQDTFLNLCRTPLGPKDPRLGPWLFKVCRHRAIDHMRKLGRMRSWEAPDRSPSLETWAEPARRAETSDDVEALRRGLARLEPRHAEVVWLRFQAALSYRQIAQVTGLTATNVGYLLHSALGRLEQCLDRVHRPQSVRGAS